MSPAQHGSRRFGSVALPAIAGEKGEADVDVGQGLPPEEAADADGDALTGALYRQQPKAQSKLTRPAVANTPNTR